MEAEMLFGAHVCAFPSHSVSAAEPWCVGSWVNPWASRMTLGRLSGISSQKVHFLSEAEPKTGILQKSPRMG